MTDQDEIAKLKAIIEIQTRQIRETTDKLREAYRKIKVMEGYDDPGDWVAREFEEIRKGTWEPSNQLRSPRG